MTNASHVSSKRAQMTGGRDDPITIMTEGWELSTRDLEVCRLGTFGWSGPLHYFVVEAGRFTKIRATRMTLIGCI